MSETNKDLAIVIGGGNGIGEAASRLMLNRGWNIVVADVDGAAVKRVSGELGCSGFELDITDEAAIIDVADKINREIGPVTTLVVAAAVFQDIVPTETLQTVEWERMLRVNLTGTFLANRVFGSNMIEHGRGGSIVNIASIAAIGSMPAEAYGTSKAGVVHLTKNLAGEWGRSGVRVNAISPGSTLVPRVEKRLASGRYTVDPGDLTALGRMVRPNEVAEAIEFLASDRASAITGINLIVDAGWHIASTWTQFGGVRKAEPAIRKST